MFGKKTLAALFVFTSLAASGCLFSQGDSCEATIQGISLDADVFNDKDGQVKAWASFEFGDMAGIGGTSLELCDTDEIRINGQAAREFENPLTNRISYEVVFSEPQPEYEFVFSREGEDDVVATVTQPPAFDLVSPSSQEEVSRQDGLTIEWDPADSGTILIDVDPEYVGEATCMNDLREDVNDEGVYVFLENELERPAGSETVDDCRVEMMLEREAAGQYPSEFDNGTIRAYQRRWVEFISVP
jgi:hypothetical protein